MAILEMPMHTGEVMRGITATITLKGVRQLSIRAALAKHVLVLAMRILGVGHVKVELSRDGDK